MKQHREARQLSSTYSLLKAVSILGLALLMGACTTAKYNKAMTSAMMESMVDQRRSILATGYAVISIQHHDNPAQQRLLSIRASKLDAYRTLMEQVYGQYLDVTTTVGEMVVESDSFRARVQGVIYGAQLVSITPVGDDTYETTLSLKRDIVDDLRVLYLQQLNSSVGS
jgi:hypothetical protein